MKRKRKQQEEVERQVLGITEFMAILIIVILVNISVEWLTSFLTPLQSIALFGGCLVVLVLTGYFRRKNKS